MDTMNIIRNLKDRIAYNESQVAHYEAEHGKWVATHGEEHSIWSELKDWHLGKVQGLQTAIDVIVDAQAVEEDADPGAFSDDAVECF